MPAVIQAAWVSYMDDVVPIGAGTLQLQESKRAFVAGAQAMLRIVTDAVNDHSLSNAQGIDVLRNLQDECDTFVADVMAKRA